MVSRQHVLLLGTNDRAALTAARSLGRAGVRTEVVPLGTPGLAERSRFVARVHDLGDPTCDVAGFLESLCQLVAESRPSLLVPINDVACELFARGRTALERNTRLALPENAVYDYARNKHRLLSLASELGVPVPSSRYVATLADIASLKQAPLRFPCYVKPVQSASIVGNRISSFHVCKVTNVQRLVDECRFHIAATPVLVQEERAGVGAGIYLLADHGRILAMAQQVRLHEPIGGGGSSYRVCVDPDPRLRDYAERLIGRIGWTGVAMVEFKGDVDRGNWSLMELNGRLWGSLALTVDAGLDFPLWLYRLCVEPEVRPLAVEAGRPEIGTRCRHLRKDAGWLLQALRARSDKRRVLWSWLQDWRHVVTGRERFDVERIHDPLPAVAEWAGLAALGCDLAKRYVQRRSAELRYRWSRRRLVDSVRAMMAPQTRILFVCRGNVMRSAFAEAYARQRIGLANVASAGTLRRFDRMVPESLERLALSEFSTDLREHRSRPLSPELLDESDVTIVMDFACLAAVLDLPRPRRPVVLLGSFLDDGRDAIADPYGRDFDTLTATCRRIAAAIDAMCAFGARVPRGAAELPAAPPAGEPHPSVGIAERQSAG